MKRKIFSLFLASVLLLSVLTACAGNGSTSGGDETKKQQPLKDSVVVGLPADMASLDPLHTVSAIDIEVNFNLFDALVKTDAKGATVPALAEKWTMSDDGLSYTFTLRKGVKFHNGELLKASDVVFSFKTAKASPYLAAMTAAIKDAVQIDENTVKIVLNYQYAPLLLAIRSIYIVPEKAYKEAGDKFGQNPIGTGAYKFVSHEVGQNIKLTRFDEYYEGAAQIKDVTCKIFSDSIALLIALKTKEVDLVTTIAMSAAKDAKANKDLAVQELENTAINVLLMNNKVKPFDNVKVRQALNYAINKDNIIQIAENGFGQPAASIVNSLSFGYSDKIKGYENNIEKAKALLTEAGYANGFKVKLKTLEQLKKGAESIQEDLRKIGITAEIEMMEQNAYVQDVMTGNYEIGNMQFGPAGADVDFWEMFLSSKGQANMFKYANPVVDKLFTEAKVSKDEQIRLAKYQELEQIISDDAAMVPLYFPTRPIVSNKDLNIGFATGTYGVKLSSLSWSK